LTDVGGIDIIASLMQKNLPATIDPWHFAARGGRLQGELALCTMDRLLPLIDAPLELLKIFLEADIDEQGTHFFAGTMAVKVALVCQRCLMPMPVPLTVAFRLGLVHTEAQAMNLPKKYDPLLIENKELVIAEWVEDELILALPLIPLHADLQQCEGFDMPEKKSATTQNAKPFAVLSNLVPNSSKE
jgi:uncharacterized protein